MGKNPVLIKYRNKVGSNTDGCEIEISLYFFEVNLMLDTVCMYQLKTYAATAQILKRITAILLLRIEYCYRSRNYFTGKMMITDDEINVLLLRISYFIYCLNSAIQCNNE